MKALNHRLPIADCPWPIIDGLRPLSRKPSYIPLLQAFMVGIMFGYGSLCGEGQIVIQATDIPHKIGSFYRAYFDGSERDVSQLAGGKGGARRWDFSQPRDTQEDIHRIDIVAVTDGGHGNEFLEAGYAERTTRTTTSAQSWSYYLINPTEGRKYYGFYDPVSNASDPLTVFNAPTVDLPETIRYGQKWKRTVDFQDTLDLGFMQTTVLIHFTSEAEVDAYGTLLLPGIGEVPALRLNEVNTYETTETTLGLPLGTQYFRNYSWLVKGLGKAVYLVSKAETSRPPEPTAVAKTMVRVFESSDWQRPAPPRTIQHLRIVRKGNEMFLTWDKELTAAGYLIQTADQLQAQATWSTGISVSDNFFFDPIPVDAVSRFYRVFWSE